MERIIKYARHHSFLVGAASIIIVIVALIVGRVIAQNKNVVESTSSNHQVSLVDVDTFNSNSNSVLADGTVESVAQADLKSQVSAPISALYVSLGSSVRAGQTIAVFKNADLVAELERAKANQALVAGQNQTGAVSLESARLTAIDKIKDAYAQADTTVHAKLDPFVLNSQVGNEQLSSYITDWRLNQNISTDRFNLNTVFTSWKQSIDSLTPNSSTSDIEADIALSQSNLNKVLSLIDEISTGLNSAANISTGSYTALLSGWKTTVTTERGAISSSISSLSNAKIALQTSASNNGTPANASLAIANAGISSINAQLAKTYVTSPITGKIAALPFRVGELVSPGQLVASVVGSGGLQVKAYISSNDFSKVKQGASVMIQGTIPGTVTTVAPSLNEQNKKVEITILVSNPETSGLVVGQTVTAAIEIDPSSSTTIATSTPITTSYFLPIQDVKITPGNASVYTVDENSKIKENPVTIGEINGDFIEVKSGITSGMKIVSPVYELNPGDTVTVR